MKVSDLSPPLIDTVDSNTDILLQDYRLTLSVLDVTWDFVIHKGFKNDRATVPWFIRPIYDRSSFGSKAPLLHDFLYAIMANGGKLRLINDQEVIVKKWAADVLFLLVAIADGIDPQIAFRGFVSVWIFGGKNLKKLRSDDG